MLTTFDERGTATKLDSRIVNVRDHTSVVNRLFVMIGNGTVGFHYNQLNYLEGDVRSFSGRKLAIFTADRIR